MGAELRVSLHHRGQTALLHGGMSVQREKGMHFLMEQALPFPTLHGQVVPASAWATLLHAGTSVKKNLPF